MEHLSDTALQSRLLALPTNTRPATNLITYDGQNKLECLEHFRSSLIVTNTAAAYPSEALFRGFTLG